MKITRDTLRADGKTVGQAMDEDAAFLRSIGIPAKDGVLTIDEQTELMKERVREVILDALDDAFKPDNGWKDQDLGVLFKAADEHAEKLFWRFRETWKK